MMQRTELLECDVCGIRRQTALGETLDALRDRLADVGWYSDPAHDYDYCPGCARHATPPGSDIS